MVSKKLLLVICTFLLVLFTSPLSMIIAGPDIIITTNNPVSVGQIAFIEFHFSSPVSHGTYNYNIFKPDGELGASGSGGIGRGEKIHLSYRDTDMPGIYNIVIDTKGDIVACSGGVCWISSMNGEFIVLGEHPLQ